MTREHAKESLEGTFLKVRITVEIDGTSVDGIIEPNLP